MNSIHDIGGMEGFGPILVEENEPEFHESWEGRAFALFATTFVSVGYNLDEFRHEIDQMGAINYLSVTYYEKWMTSFEGMLARRNIVSREEHQKRISELKKGEM